MMPMQRNRLVSVIFVLLAAVLPAYNVSAENQVGQIPTIHASNYCLGCHSTGDMRLNHSTTWQGGIAHNLISPCPAVNQITEELYYTERLMLAIERSRALVPDGVDLSRSDTRLAAARQAYSRLLDSPVTSLEAFISESKLLRFQLGKVYSTISKAVEAEKRARVLWIAVGITLVLTISLVWGWVNAQRALKKPHNTISWGGRQVIIWGVFLLIVFVVFALPIFRIPSQTIAAPDIEEQERQAVLDDSQRASMTADRELSRAWALATIGARWAQIDQAKGAAILEEALAAAQEAQNNVSALWGLSQGALEAGGAEGAMQSEAQLVAAELDAMRGRSWGQRLIAEAWIPVDKAKAQEILESALVLTDSAIFPYNQLDLRALAVTWAQLDSKRGVALARSISDPALRSWALREIAATTGDDALLDEAAQAAREVLDPVQRARALREVGAAAQRPALFEEAASSLQDLEGALRAFALADLVAATKDASLVDEISAGYPEAQALAYFYLGDFQKAWDATAQIIDPFERARAQSMAAGAWGNADAALAISSPLFKDRALRDISLKTGNLSLVHQMQDNYYQVQVLAALGEYSQAWQAADGLHDSYPLIALGTGWAASDPQSAAQVVEALSLEKDKAVVLLAIAAATGVQDDFERALRMALAARVRGDSLSPVQASLDVAQKFSALPEEALAALLQAYQVAFSINIKY